MLKYALFSAALVLSLFAPILSAQTNVVPNPSFSLKQLVPTPTGTNPLGLHWVTRLNGTTKYPSLADPNHVDYWFRGNQATPDYYHYNSGNPIGFTADAGVKVPQNWSINGYLWGAGMHDSAYAGINIVRNSDGASGTPLGTFDYREYLAVRLSEHLEQGKDYRVRFKYALPQLVNPLAKTSGGTPAKAKYFLSKLGVAFAPNPNFITYDTTEGWETGTPYNRQLNLVVNMNNYVSVRNLPFADSAEWQTFQTRFTCSDSTLEYMIIGSFDQRIALGDIQVYPKGDIPDPDNQTGYEFYHFIDSVSVQEIESGACNCSSINVQMSKRDSLLEVANPDNCCFIASITPTAFSCDFFAVRVSQLGTPVSSPAIKNFGHIVTDTETVQVSFCIEKNENETSSTVLFEFLDEDSNVVCTKTEYVYCNCPCIMTQRQFGIIKLIPEPVAGDSGRCCWEYSVENSGSCDFLPTSASLAVHTYPSNGIFTPISPWVQSYISDRYKYTSAMGFPHGYSTSATKTKIFKVCVDSHDVATTPLSINVWFSADSVIPGVGCYAVDEQKLWCIESANCCDKLNIELRKYGTTSHDCAFRVVLSDKGSPDKCKVFGVRIKDSNGDTLYTLSPQGTALNLNTPKQIWEENLGGCPNSSAPNSYGIVRAYEIEILDSTGTIQCSVKDTIRCCYLIEVPFKPNLEEEPAPIPLSVGGIFSETKVEGNTLHYSIKNMGDDLHATIKLSDLKGNALLQRQVNLPKGNSAGEFDISQLASGTYFLSVQTDLWQTTRQIVIVR